MQKKSARNSNIELLRILSMLMIVAHHYAVFGFYAEDLAFSRNKIFVDLFGMGPRVGVDLFVLISGYFLVSARFRLRKLLIFMGSVWFYSLGMLAVFALTGLARIGAAELRGALLPLLTGQYWFASYYALLLLFSPFLNAMLGALDRRRHLLLCLLLTALCTVQPELLHLTYAEGILPLFTALYLCGAYIRLHVPAGTRAANGSLLCALAVLLLCALKIVLGDMAAQRAGDYPALEGSLRFLGVYSPYALLAAVLLLMSAACRPPADNRFVCRVGGLCFGVYLFHANPFLSGFVWQGVFHTAEMADSPRLILHALGTTAALFAAGCLVERLRLLTAARVWERAVDAVLPRLEKRLRLSDGGGS